MRITSFALTLALFQLGCSTAEDDRVRPALPERASFVPVADLLGHRCGTLDCHGTPYRNFRIYGHEGQRLASGDLPTRGATTTTAEYDATYESLVGLEPELLSAVITEHGAAPERLTLVRKARGTEHHKGGTLMVVGDDEDRCITRWLAGAPDSELCVQALARARL